MIASNKDILEFFFDGVHRAVRKMTPAEKNEHEHLFTDEKQYAPTKGSFERGWTYGFVGTKFFSAFIALASDSKEQMLFHELRYKGKTLALGECICDAEHKGRKMSIAEKERKLEWTGSPPEYEVSLELKGEKGSLKFLYKFSRISKKIGFYRCVYRTFNQMLAYWFLSPMKAALQITGDGDLSEFKLGEFEELVNTTIETNFAYTENVKILVPMIQMGWYWHFLNCYEGEDWINPSKIVGFMDLFFLDKKRQMLLPLNFQMYYVDAKTGAFRVFGEAQCELKWEKDAAEFKANELEKHVSFQVKNSSPVNTRQIRGKKFYGGVTVQNIDYSSFSNEGTARIGRKKYNVIGTSEITGREHSVWI